MNLKNVSYYLIWGMIFGVISVILFYIIDSNLKQSLFLIKSLGILMMPGFFIVIVLFNFCFSYCSPREEIISKIAIMIINFVIYFLIGVLVGWIIRKIKSK